MASAVNPPRVAVVAIISDNQGRVVIGRRIGPLGGGQWAFPGGHIEYGEEIFECVERETLEETGLAIRGVQVIAVTNDVFVEADKHYITIFTKCERVDQTQQPQRLEPNKCEGWTWKSWDEIKTLASNALALSNPAAGIDIDPADNTVNGVVNNKSQKKPSSELFLPVVNLVRDNPRIDELVTAI
ncbi:NUDIX hydrolase domain-like protein [Rhypophila decipiens]